MRLPLLALTVALAACGQSKDAAQPTNGAAPASDTAAPAESTAAPAANVSYKPGDNLVTLKDKATCRETGPEAGEPWELSKGAFVQFIRAEGSELRVDSGGGIECLVAPDAVGPA